MKTVTNNNMWVLLLSTIRYSMGRRTYMSSLAPELVMEYWEYLSTDQLNQIRKEVEKELEIDREYPKHLGMDCDRDSWKSFVIICAEEVERRDTDV